MPTIKVQNVNVFDGNIIQQHSGIYFADNPGGILTPESDPDSIIDGTGCTILPGLIDSKIDAGASPELLSICSAYGVTTVIDSSSSSAESKAMAIAAADESEFPSFRATGSAIASGNSSLPTIANYSATEVITTADEAERVVEDKIASNRADFLKVIVDQPGLDPTLLAAIVRAAHSHGKLAIAHATQSKSYALAVEAGFDILSPVPIDGVIEPDVVAKIVDRGIGIIPTLCFLRKAMPLWKTKNSNYSLSNAITSVTMLHSAGARICAGTSANTSEDTFIPIGRGIYDELELLTTAGLSNLEAIRAGTCQPATLFGLRDRGCVRVGQRADLIMVEGNPLDDINFFAKIRRVWIRGVAVTMAR